MYLDLIYLHIPESLEALHAVKMWLYDVSLGVFFRTTQLQDQLQSKDARQNSLEDMSEL